MSQEQLRPELPVEGLAEGLLRDLEEGAAVPKRGRGAAAQDDDVPQCAFRGFDVGDARDGHERFGRALGAGLPLEEAARLPDRERIARVEARCGRGARAVDGKGGEELVQYGERVEDVVGLPCLAGGVRWGPMRA